MHLIFICTNNDEVQECRQVIQKELENHHISARMEIPYNSFVVSLELNNKEFIFDLENAKRKLYAMKDFGEDPYMTDFISDVFEYLSFVPTMECTE